MALPAKIKTWQLSSNLNPEFPGTDANSVGALFVLVKDAMIAFASNGWTCEGSSDAATAGMDAVDRLTDYTKIVRPGGTHSWIVLQQAALGSSPTQICFDWNAGDPEEVYLWMSPSAGFTGGSTSARPTATDEVGVLPPYGGRFNFVPESHISSQGTSVRAHVMMSTDGKSTRIICCEGNVARTFISIDEPVHFPTGWTDPVALTCLGTTGGPTAPPQDPMSIYFMINSDSFIRSKGPIGDMHMNFCLQGFAQGGSSDGTVVGYTPWPNANELSGGTDYPITGIAMMHKTTVGQRGRHGWFPDLYITASSVSQGKSFPGDGTKSWVVFGNMVLPWDGGDVEIG